MANECSIRQCGKKPARRVVALKLLVALVLVFVAASERASAQPAADQFVLKCMLAHTAHDGVRNKPFLQHFKIDLQADRVDGIKATVTDTQIGWRPHHRFFGPYATLSRPAWRFRSAAFYRGQAPDQVTGTCVVGN